jgi:hypothetical protein
MYAGDILIDFFDCIVKPLAVAGDEDIRTFLDE